MVAVAHSDFLVVRVHGGACFIQAPKLLAGILPLLLVGLDKVATYIDASIMLLSMLVRIVDQHAL